jgi:hypothetical protein
MHAFFGSFSEESLDYHMRIWYKYYATEEDRDYWE